MERQAATGLELRCARSSGGDAYSAALRHTTNIYFPKTDAVTFEQANTSQIFGEGVELTPITVRVRLGSDWSVLSSPAKLKELNEGAPQEHRLTEETLENLEGLLESVCDPSKPPPTLQQLSLLWKAAHWPEGTTARRSISKLNTRPFPLTSCQNPRRSLKFGKLTCFPFPADIVFPVLDILRLAVRHPLVNEHLCGEAEGVQLCNHLLSLMRPEGRPANQMLALRTLCNCFSGRHGRALLMAHRHSVLARAADLAAVCNKNIHIALATVALNYAGCLHSQPDLEAKAQCLSVVSKALETVQDKEAVFRLLVALGTTVALDRTAQDLARSLGVSSQISKYSSGSEPSKVAECCRLILKELQCD